MLFRKTFPVGPLQCNCTILACEQTQEAVIIDPGGDALGISQIIEHHQLTVKAIIHTHAHVDHMYCTSEIHQAHGGIRYLHPGDKSLAQTLSIQAAWIGLPPISTPTIDTYMEDGDTILFGQKHALVLHTPGHTPGSVCFHVEHEQQQPLLFAGDTLFHRSVGRTDLPGGDIKTLTHSIKQKIYTLEPDTLVIPGHGPNTHIGQEAVKNPFVQA